MNLIYTSNGNTGHYINPKQITFIEMSEKRRSIYFTNGLCITFVNEAEYIRVVDLILGADCGE